MSTAVRSLGDEAAANRKGIATFLLITFGVTYAVEGALGLAGFRWEGVPPLLGQYLIIAVMWVPALAAGLTLRFVHREGLAGAYLRFGPLKPYLFSILIIPLVFALVYALTWLLGLGRPDWGLEFFQAQLVEMGADLTGMPPAGQILSFLFLSSLVTGPTLNALFAFGEELGWRGYLLPRLMPLGKPKAYLLLGLIWGLWHAPLILMGFNYPGYPLAGVVWMCALTLSIGIFINEMTLRYRSSILAGVIHGAFNGQAYGIWRILFPTAHPLLGGMAGLVGILVFALLGLWTLRRFSHRPAAEPGQAAPARPAQPEG